MWTIVLNVTALWLVTGCDILYYMFDEIVS